MKGIDGGESSLLSFDDLTTSTRRSSCFVFGSNDNDDIATRKSNDWPSNTTWEQHLEANVVDEESDREKLRMEIMEEAVQAEVVEVGGGGTITTTGAMDQLVDLVEDLEDQLVENLTKKRKKKVIKWCFRTIVILVVALGLGLGFGLRSIDTEHHGMDQVDDNDDDSSNHDDGNMQEWLPPADGQQEETVVVGKDTSRPTSGGDDGGGNIVGICADHCKSVALLALGDSSKVEQVPVIWSNRFNYLTNKTVDVLTEGTTNTMGRDIQEPTSSSGFSFSTSWFYSGLSFGGIPRFVDCADALDTFNGDCRSLRVCTIAGSTHVHILQSVLRGTNLVLVNSTNQMADSIASGVCNVAAGEPPNLVKLQGGSEWKLGSTVLSKEPLGLVTRDDDPAWTALVNLVVDGPILAERHGITKEDAHKMAELFVGEDGSSTGDGTSELSTLMVSLISEFGNFGESYDAQVEETLPRRAFNGVYYHPRYTTGLMYSLPLGRVLEKGPGPSPNGEMNTILQRGYLLCGVHVWRGAGFAAREDTYHENSTTSEEKDVIWSGMDVQVCNGITSALFAGKIDGRVAFVEMNSILDSYDALSTGTVDIVAGARVSLQTQYFEPTTGQGYKFSTAYFYDTENSNDAYALMTRKDDVQWNDFVNWIIQSSIYAEENVITSMTSADMPVVELFGSGLLQMFRDCIFVMGSLDELWNNTLGKYTPRSGANKLNSGSGPQLYPIPAI